MHSYSCLRRKRKVNMIPQHEAVCAISHVFPLMASCAAMSLAGQSASWQTAILLIMLTVNALSVKPALCTICQEYTTALATM